VVRLRRGRGLCVASGPAVPLPRGPSGGAIVRIGIARRPPVPSAGLNARAAEVRSYGVCVRIWAPCERL